MRFTAKPRELFLSLFLGLLVWSFSGCATSHPRPSLHLTGDPLIDGQIAIAQGPPEDRLLWKYRISFDFGTTSGDQNSIGGFSTFCNDFPLSH